MSEAAARGAAEAALRNSYGRLVAYLAARSGDVAGAEDALGDALLAAWERWPVEGVPDKPEAWLLRAARNRVIDASRRTQVRRKATPELERCAQQAQEMAEGMDPFPDERLKLLFVCAHPAIDPAARTPLMLQTVLGVDAARIASAFLTSPAAMAQRLVRAKLKIRAAAIPFRVPEPAEWPDRIAYVLDAIYSGYTAGWENVNNAGSTCHGLAWEAIELGRMLAALTPWEPEALGLLALMLHCQARGPARYSRDGEFVPLDRQDTSLWSRPLMEEAEARLREAAALGRMGRYQLEAAIQSIHASRAVTGRIDWRQIALLYEGLARISPSVGTIVGRAVALAHGWDPAMGLETLETLPAARIATYQPYWAARARLLQMLGRQEEAAECYQRAASLTEDPALRRHLLSSL